MSFLDRLISQRSLERPTTPLTQEALAELLNGPASYTGRTVNASTALQLTAVFACVDLLSETFGSLPALVYHRLARGRERAPEHSLYPVLHDVANPEQTSIDYRSMCMAHVLLYGHTYSEISRNGAGDVKALWPLAPWCVTPGRNARNELIYQVSIPGQKPVNLAANRVVHVSGLLGLSRIGQARQALGLAMAAEEYGARFFSNNSQPGGILEHPGNLSDDAQARLKASWEITQAGLSNAHRVAILEEGMKWHQMGLPPEDAQFLETRKFQTAEIARLFRVPPYMIGDVERSTSWGTGIEQQNIGFIVYSLRSWLVRFEQEYNWRLLTDTERKIYFMEFLVDGLLRGDMKSRYDAYAIARQNGWMNGNEIRELENMNPVDGLDTYLANGSLMPADGREASANQDNSGQEDQPEDQPVDQPEEDQGNG